MSSPRRGLALLGLAFLGFISLGLPDGLLGVAWPRMRTDFALRPSALGPLLLAATCGYVASSAASGWILARIGVGTLLGASCLATAGSLLGYIASGAWPFVVASGVLAGLGAGAIDAGLNAWVARHHSARTVSWLHACYGVGAAAGPILMATLLASGHGWRSGYGLVAQAQIGLALAFLWSRGRWQSPVAPAQQPTRGGGGPPSLRHASVWLGVAAFVVYTGIEASAGAWSYSLLAEGRGLTMAIAAGAVSAFWGGLTLGRVVAGALAAALAPAAILRASLAGTVAGASLVWLDPLPGAALAGLGLLGLACGPIFPTLIAATPARVGAERADATVGFQIAGAAVGQAGLPALLGVAIAALGLEIVPPALVAAALALAALCAALERVSRAPASRSAPCAASRARDAAARAGSPR